MQQRSSLSPCRRLQRVAVCASAAIAMLLSTHVHATDPGMDSYMTRAITCEGPGAKMELYIRQSIALARDEAIRKMRPTIGFYALDLTEAGKGKPPEPVRVSMSADGKSVIVNQYTRKLPPTRIPIGGGVVNFDNRFGTEAKCGPFNDRSSQ